jgi:hypothetical protein
MSPIIATEVMETGQEHDAPAMSVPGPFRCTATATVVLAGESSPRG